MLTLFHLVIALPFALVRVKYLNIKFLNSDLKSIQKMFSELLLDRNLEDLGI